MELILNPYITENKKINLSPTILREVTETEFLVSTRKKIPQRVIQAKAWSLSEDKEWNGMRSYKILLPPIITTEAYFLNKLNTIIWIRRKIKEDWIDLANEQKIYRIIIESMLTKELSRLKIDSAFHGSFYNNINEAIELQKVIIDLQLPF